MINSFLFYSSILIAVILLTILANQSVLAVITQQQENNNSRTANIEKQLASLDLTIQEGLTECSSLKNDNCIAVMNVLDNVCQSIYLPYCFGPMWDKFVEYKQDLINEGHLPEYEDDSYYNLNNDHYGNDSSINNNNNNKTFN
jgi:hypothetical protein